MPQLYDTERETVLGSISEQQLQALIDALEEESLSDQDYYIDSATVDMLEEDGADPQLVGLLRTALEGREGMEVRWTSD